nr:NACHT domain-containing protein [Methanosarcina sp. UBA5]
MLESENNKVGDLFSRLMGDLFSSLGYEGIRYNIHKTGREIDLQGSHRLEGRHFVAECKAVKNKVGGDNVNKFVGVIDAEKRKNPNTPLIGYFVSLWGFTESAIEQENEFEVKRLILLEENDIIRELIKGNIIVSPEKAIERAGRCASDFSDHLNPEINCELLAVHDMGWIWAVYFEEYRERTHFALIHASGESISSELAKEIIDKDKRLKGKLHLLKYLPPKFQTTREQARINEAKTKYFEYLANECGEITLEGLPADQEVGSRRLRLENIFIPLRLEEEYPPNSGTSYKENVEKKELQSAGKVFSENRRLAILAAPGGGKTTLLKRLATAYAFPDRREIIDDDLPENSLLPIFIRCRQLGDFANSSISDILRTIPKKFEREDLENEFLYIVNTSLQKGDALLLIDGLDEISNDGSRISFVKQFRNFLSVYPNIRIVVTSREAGFRVVSGSLNDYCKKYKIADFTNDDIKRLTVAWNKEVVGNKPEIILDSEKLANNICNSDRVRQLAKNPLLLTTLLLVNRWVGQLPTKRSVLYGKAIEVLLMTWNVEGHDPIDPDETIPQLSFVAFSMMKEGVQRISSRRFRELLEIARKQMPEILGYTRINALEFIKRVELRSSLMILSGHEIEQGTLYPMYEFQHLTFQEYLTARAVVDGYYPDRKDTDTILEILQPYLENQQWKEVIPLTAVLADRRAQPLIEQLITQCKNLPTFIAKKDDPSDSVSPLVLLGQCILDEVKVVPNKLQESFEWLSRRETPKEILLQIYKGKFGEEYKEVVQKVYLSSYEDLLSLSNALIITSEVEFKNTSELKLSSDNFEKINTLLEDGETLEKAKGALATMVAAFSFYYIWKRSKFETSGDKLENIKYKLKDLGDKLSLLLYSDDIHLYLPACWAYAWLGSTHAWSPESEPNIISRLFEIWRDSKVEEVQYLAYWAIARLPLMNRDAYKLLEPNIQSINFIKKQFRSRQKNRRIEMKKLACLVMGFYWKTPWDDKEIDELIESMPYEKGRHNRYYNIKEELKLLHDSLGEPSKIALKSVEEKELTL